jgi:hypothetical protein
MAFKIESGYFGDLALDGLGFVVVAVTPEEMGKGNWSVGVVVDERASTAQRDAITGIASGQAGGPMAALGGLVGKFLGVESAPIAFSDGGAADTFTLARASDSRIAALGVSWSDASGRNNAQYAPFAWKSA